MENNNKPELIVGDYSFVPPTYSKKQEVAQALFGSMLETIDKSCLKYCLRDFEFYRKLFKCDRNFFVPRMATVQGMRIRDKEFAEFGVHRIGEVEARIESKEYQLKREFGIGGSHVSLNRYKTDLN